MKERFVDDPEALPPKILFVTVGSGDFDPLIRAVDALAPSLDLPVVTQIGIGRYVPQHAYWFRLAPSLEPFYERAQVVVAHGGIGVTIEVLARGIPLVSVDNPDRPDHHQEDLLGYLSGRGHLIWCRDMKRLGEAIRRAREEPLVPFVLPPLAIHLIVEKYIQALIQGRNPDDVVRPLRGKRVTPEDVHGLP